MQPHYPSAGTAAHIPAGSYVGGNVASTPSAVRSPSRGGGPADQPSAPNGAPPAAGDEGGLSAPELAALRVVELDSKVKVSADVSNRSASTPMEEMSPSKLTLQPLCDDATAKVFPKHVVFARANGSPVVEIVIGELFELTEDDTRHSLTFYLQRTSGVAVIEVACANAATRSALYKIVCAKRNQLDG